MHEGDNVYLRAGVPYGSRKGPTVYRRADVNDDRRRRKALGMTGKQYRKFLKKQRREES